jgi:hypothetical protein
MRLNPPQGFGQHTFPRERRGRRVHDPTYLGHVLTDVASQPPAADLLFELPQALSLLPSLPLLFKKSDRFLLALSAGPLKCLTIPFDRGSHEGEMSNEVIQAIFNALTCAIAPRVMHTQVDSILDAQLEYTIRDKLPSGLMLERPGLYSRCCRALSLLRSDRLLDRALLR